MGRESADDTSVLISALRSERGAAAEVIRCVMLGELTVLMNHQGLLTLLGRLALRAKIGPD